MYPRISPFIVLCLGLPFLASADIVISEIMYDLPGRDSGREWVEIKNIGSISVDLASWKLDDGRASKHGLNLPPINGGQGTSTIAPGSYFMLVSDAYIFLSEHRDFSGTVMDTVVDLGQKNDRTYNVKLLDASGVVVDSFNYATMLGANGDGNSLQKTDAGWIDGVPTPGADNISLSPPIVSTRNLLVTSEESGDSLDGTVAAQDARGITENAPAVRTWVAPKTKSLNETGQGIFQETGSGQNELALASLSSSEDSGIGDLIVAPTKSGTARIIGSRWLLLFGGIIVISIGALLLGHQGKSRKVFGYTLTDVSEKEP